MGKGLGVAVDDSLKNKSEKFIEKLESKMHYKSELATDSMALDWLEKIEFACPYIDDIVKHPKLDLMNEEEVVKIEQAKKITVASIKNLSKNTHFIERIDPVTKDIYLSKILIERREEAYNTYENRVIFTLMHNLEFFISKKESALEELKIKNDKILEYAASTANGDEKVNIELKVTSKQLPNGKDHNDFLKEIEAIKQRIKRIKQYAISWRVSEFVKQLVKASAPYVVPPINKTNLLLSNTNYNTAMNLYDYLGRYNESSLNNSKDSLDTAGDDILKGLLDDSFLMDYFVLDSISSSKREQKEKISKYAIVMINQQLKRLISLLLSSGIEVTEEQILKMVSIEMANEKRKLLIGSNDIKNKFKESFSEYLDKAKDYM